MALISQLIIEGILAPIFQCPRLPQASVAECLVQFLQEVLHQVQAQVVEAREVEAPEGEEVLVAAAQAVEAGVVEVVDGNYLYTFAIIYAAPGCIKIYINTLNQN